MSYATVQDLTGRYGEDEVLQLTDFADNDAVDDTVAQRALDDATAEIDTYLAARYVTPLEATPSVVVGMCCDIARYRMHGHRASEDIRIRYEDARALLRDIARGLASIDSTQKSGFVDDTEISATHEAADRVFTQDSLSEY